MHALTLVLKISLANFRGFSYNAGMNESREFPHAPLLAFDALVDYGVSKTVYSYMYPEVDTFLAKVQAEEANQMHARHAKPWTKQQDKMHGEFAQAWLNATASLVTISEACKTYFYPCAGSSEAIRETLVKHFAMGRTLHIFDGEYEGYQSTAHALGMSCVSHPRDAWDAALEDCDRSDIWMLSNPSSIDGEYWSAWDAFATKASQRGTLVYLDLAYVGATIRPECIKGDYPCVEGLIFSLSKSYGVYYHRIGGIFTRSDNKLLYGNMWFKNLNSLYLGTRLLNTFPLDTMPAKYAYLKGQALEALERDFGIHAHGSNVWMLATTSDERLSSWRRTSDQAARLCLTGLCDSLANP